MTISPQLQDEAVRIYTDVGLRARWTWNPAPPDFSPPPDGIELETGDRWCIVIHHSGNNPSFDPKAVQDEHRAVGYADIGYHYLIHPDGHGWVGRDIFYKGSHAKGHNDGTIGILLMGDYHRGSGLSNGGADLLDGYGSDPISAVMLETCARLVERLKQAFPTIRALGSHNDFNNTSCPGDQMRSSVGDLRSQALLQHPMQTSVPVASR